MSLDNVVKLLSDYADQNQEELVDFLKEFIAIESVTYNEKEAVEFLAGKMKEFNFDEVRIDKVGNVLGRVGNGENVILFDAHIDTVEPGDEKDWGFNPLDAQIVDGYIHGRGAVDDKGCLAAMTFAGKAIKDLGLEDEFTMWVSGSISEEDVEGTCSGAMLEESPDIKPDFILVGEASENRIVRGHKGRALIKITVPGKAAHASAAWRGENALIKSLPIIEGIDKLNSFEEDSFLGKGTIEVTKVDCKTPSLNTIPGEVVITCDRRISLGESIEDLIEELQPIVSKVEGATIEIDTESVKTYTDYEITCVDYFPSWVMPEDHKIVEAGVDAYKQVFGEDPTIGRWDFCTNATFLCGITGIPAVGFGPGDSSLCHSTEDKVLISELVNAVKFYATFPFSICK